VIKKILLGFLAILTILIILNIELVGYGLAQGYGQLKILLGARSVDKVMADEKISTEVKDKLNLAQDIREYSMNRIGLQNSKNYTTLYDQKGEPVLWVVRACHPYKLENVEWTFPFVGTVSYKGYFNLDKAIKLRDELNEQGYDTYIREVSAWSTLGWFKDPILSEMLKEESGDLANTIIHELTHATIFVKDSITFNENLASFIGDKGAEQFLIDSYSDSLELIKYQNLKNDRAAYAQHFLRGAQYLDSLYKSFPEGEVTEEMKEAKRMAILEIVINLDSIGFHNPVYSNRFQEYLPNNAYFMSYLLYRSGQDQLDSLYREKYESNLTIFITELKKLHPK